MRRVIAAELRSWFVASCSRLLVAIIYDRSALTSSAIYRKWMTRLMRHTLHLGIHGTLLRCQDALLHTE